MLQIRSLYKNFGKTIALHGADLECSRGSVVALMGPNGSGKSTLMKSILGLVIPDSGEIKIDGLLVDHGFEYRNNIGYMPQTVNYPQNLRVAELFEILKNLRTGQTDDELIQEFKVGKVVDKKFGQLSGGMKQRVSAAIAFLFSPKILILDEPTSSLDPLSAEIMKSKIHSSREAGKLILVSSHLVSEVDEIADRLAFMLEGKIVIDRQLTEIRNGFGEARLGKAITELLAKI